MICLFKLLKSFAGYFCLFCCWSWRGSTHCHHLISTMIWLRENDNKMVQSWELHLSWLQSISWTKWCWQPGQEVSKVTGGWRRDAELFNILVQDPTPFWWQVVGQRSLCYVARFGFGLMKVLNFYQLQAVAIMVTITVCKSNMVSGMVGRQIFSEGGFESFSRVQDSRNRYSALQKLSSVWWSNGFRELLHLCNCAIGKLWAVTRIRNVSILSILVLDQEPGQDHVFSVLNDLCWNHCRI